MPDSKRFLHPEAIKRIARLEIRARHIVEGFLSGMHRSPYFGQSVEFLQHREYTPGDDLRHVDWKVWAKQDRYYVKQFEEDTNLRCTLLVDVSSSMQYGSGPLNKYEYACTAAVEPGLPAAAAAGRGRLRGVRRASARRTCRCAAAQITSDVDHPGARRQPAARQDRRWRRPAASRRGKLSAPRHDGLVSDLLADVESTLHGFKLLRQRGHDVLVFHVMDDDELDFPFDGPTRFEGWSCRALELQPAGAARRISRGGRASSSAALRHGCARDAVDYALIRTSQPLDAALAAFLSRRLAARSRASCRCESGRNALQRVNQPAVA